MPISLIGKKLPAFRLSDNQGKLWTNADLAGHQTVLYAYPKAMTSGCTVESCDFRDQLSVFKKHGVHILGISADAVDRQAKFVEKEKLTFPLLADPDKVLLTKLGIWIEKSLYGRKYMGIERSTFLIDAKGVITHEWRGVKVPGHVAAVLNAVQ